MNRNSHKFILPSIFSVPLWTITKRLLLCTAVPSLNHLISGVGVPVARHDSVATLPLGRVWFVGPIWMTGGGMSSTDMTWKITKIMGKYWLGRNVFRVCGRKKNIWVAMSTLPYQYVYLLRFGGGSGGGIGAHVFTFMIFNHWHFFFADNASNNSSTMTQTKVFLLFFDCLGCVKRCDRKTMTEHKNDYILSACVVCWGELTNGLFFILKAMLHDVVDVTKFQSLWFNDGLGINL